MKKTIVISILTVAISLSGQEKGKGQRPDLKKLDKNGDSAISEQEAGPQIWARLGQLDKNGDGKIAGAEFPRPGGGGKPGGPGKGTPGDFMKRIDKNGDGNISKEEAPEPVWARLSKLDKNGDNSISKEEFAAARSASSGEFFEKLDKDKNGKITEIEAPKFWKKLGKADLDKDGSVSKEELTKARAYAERAKGGMSGMGKGKRQQGGTNAIFARYDEDKDGKLNQEEVPAELWAKLSKADSNADGRVSKEELANVYKKMQGMGMQPQPTGKPKRPEMETDA